MTFVPSLEDWIRLHATFEPDPERHVEKVEFAIEATDSVLGVEKKPVFFTDVQFQGGNMLTGWERSPQEFLKRLYWTVDENKVMPSVNSWNTVEDPNPEGSPAPVVYNDVGRRLFNITMRGHATITIPNYLPEDWRFDTLPSGIDLSIKPKDDFDVCRISTAHGAWYAEEKQMYKAEGTIYAQAKAAYEDALSIDTKQADAVEMDKRQRAISNWSKIKGIFEEHPLHYHYTREFWFDGRPAGTELKVHATTRVATIGGNKVKIVGEKSLPVNGTQISIPRKKFMLAPNGTALIRIEFYKEVEDSIIMYDSNDKKVRKTFKYLKDTGIGYYGTATFLQWTDRTTYNNIIKLGG
jgi:hypothetical protein